MEYHEIINLLDITPNHSCNFKTKNWGEINDESRRTYGEGDQIIFKNSILRSSLCFYSNAYILVKGTIKVGNTAAQDEAVNNANKKVIFKNCAPFINYIDRINNTQVVGAHDIDTVMPMHNLIECINIYSKTFGI